MTLHRKLPAVAIAALVGAVMALLPTAAVALQSPFVAATGGVWDGPGNPIVPEQIVSDATGPVLVETGSGPTVAGRFRAAMGSNGFAINVQGGINREIDGGSIWSDGFTVGGGSGSGVLTLSSHIVGTVSGHAEMFYALYVSEQPFDLQTVFDTITATDGFWQLQLPGAQRLAYTAVANGCGQPKAMGDCGHVPLENYQGPLDLVTTVRLPFSYGRSFYVASGFGGGVGIFGGSADFFGSADFGITVPAGATLSSLSGQAYAAAVPEPATWALLAAGLGALQAGGRRRA